MNKSIEIMSECGSELKPNLIYLTIPVEYICTYHKLLVYFADFGKSLLDDCSASCKGNNKTVIDCWNLFQSALACKALGQDKQADLFIDYINKQLNIVYRGEEQQVFNGVTYYIIDSDGKLKTLYGCKKNNIKFEIDIKTGQLYQTNINEDAFDIEDNNLIVETNNKI